MKTRTFLLITALAVFVGGPAAFAAPSVDTLLTAGYDAEEMKLIFGSSDVYDEDSTRAENNTNSLDCRLVGEYEYVLDTLDTDGEDGTRVSDLTPLASMLDDDSDTLFEQEDEDATGADVIAPAEYGTPGAAECDLTAFDVQTNGNGEVNHGKVVSTFVHALKDLGYKGAGCLVRHIAQTEWGKEDPEDTVDGAPLTVDLEAFEASCNLAKKDKGDDDATAAGGHGKGKPPWAGPNGDKSLKPGNGGNDD